MRIIIYRDLKHDGRHGYQMHDAKPGSVFVKEQVIPGAFGYPDLYVRHLYVNLGDEPIMVISQTEYELDGAKRDEILSGAKLFLDH